MADIVTDRTSKEDDFSSSHTPNTYRTSNGFSSLPLLKNSGETTLPESIPASIFNHGLSGLEALVFYLKDLRGLRFCEIASLLNRDDRTIWDAYSEARQKAQGISFSFLSPLAIPLSIFQDRDLGVLEALSEYLKDSMQLRYCQIAKILGKNDRTIWTAYTRAKKKRKLHHAS